MKEKWVTSLLRMLGSYYGFKTTLSLFTVVAHTVGSDDTTAGGTRRVWNRSYTIGKVIIGRGVLQVQFGETTSITPPGASVALIL